MQKALLVIDVQNDYFAGGKLPLADSEATLAAIERAIGAAQAKDIPVVLVQHVADASSGAPFFHAGTPGVEIHPRVRAAAPEAPVVTKDQADGFAGTTLGDVLAKLGTKELLVCGMMTQNCVTHTAISKAAEAFDVAILPDACTTVDPLIHGLALHALSTRVKLLPVSAALG